MNQRKMKTLKTVAFFFFSPYFVRFSLAHTHPRTYSQSVGPVFFYSSLFYFTSFILYLPQQYVHKIDRCKNVNTFILSGDDGTTPIALPNAAHCRIFHHSPNVHVPSVAYKKKSGWSLCGQWLRVIELRSLFIIDRLSIVIDADTSCDAETTT